ncbi:MAG: hypothetical protein PVF34_07125 [Gammaproteobacteria bacterium]|jgi:hypothetical protein
MILPVLLGAVLQVAATALPNGHDDVTWGMTVSDVKSLHEVHKAGEGSQYSYADHMEKDPEVYVRRTGDNKKIEYYFFEGKLYKIYVVYDRNVSTQEFYLDLIGKAQKQYGKFQSNYQENVMGITVLHVKWDDGQSIMDLRNGAGYVYEVLIDKAAKKKKLLEQQRDRSI